MPWVTLRSDRPERKEWRLAMQIPRVPVAGDELADEGWVYPVVRVRMVGTTATRNDHTEVWVHEPFRQED